MRVNARTAAGAAKFMCLLEWVIVPKRMDLHPVRSIASDSAIASLARMHAIFCAGFYQLFVRA